MSEDGAAGFQHVCTLLPGWGRERRWEEQVSLMCQGSPCEHHVQKYPASGIAGQPHHFPLPVGAGG